MAISTNDLHQIGQVSKDLYKPVSSSLEGLIDCLSWDKFRIVHTEILPSLPQETGPFIVGRLKGPVQTNGEQL